jgi:hypothetical protein
VSLHIDQDARANIIAVLSRVREPRTLRDIAWHIPNRSILQVAYTLDVLVIRGDVRLILDPNAAKRYVLCADYYRIPDTRGFNTDKALRRVVLVVSAAAAIAMVVILWRAIPW